MWLVVIIVVALIVGFVCMAASDEGDRATGFISGLIGGAGCAGSVVIHILIYGLLFMGMIWLFGFLFGGC